jgi:hypothetical protein
LSGALVGGVAGKGTGAGIGALAGAAVGGLVGWQIGEYQSRKVRDAGDGATAYRYSPQQGVVATVEKTEATPDAVRPGDRVVLRTDYTILVPSGSVKVKEVRTLLFNGQELGHVEHQVDRASGTYASEQPIALPADAVEGTYVVQTAVRPVSVAQATPGQASSEFRVQETPAVAVSSRSLAPSTSARPGIAAADVPLPVVAAVPAAVAPEPRSRSAAPSQSVTVTAVTANLRGGPGTGFAVLTTASRGMRFDVIDIGGKDRDRWYKIKLSDGRDAWVAASLVSAAPR